MLRVANYMNKDNGPYLMRYKNTQNYVAAFLGPLAKSDSTFAITLTALLSLRWPVTL